MKEITIDLDARYEMVPVLARKYLDAPAKLYGRDLDSGIDCLGVVAIAATQVGFHCPHMLIRTPDATGKRPPMMEAIELDMVRVATKEIRTGDMLWLQPNMGRRWDHLAIVSKLNPIEIIHTDPLAVQKVKEHRLSDPVINQGMFITPQVCWDSWVKGAYRFQALSLDLPPEIESVILTSSVYGHKTITKVGRA
jgi:hypothetical protein